MTPEAYIIQSMFMIPNKDKEDVPFELNSAQQQLDDNFTGRDIIPKARQEGVSSYFLARYTAACMMYRNVKAVIISHEALATQRLLKRCQYFLKNIRGPQPVIQAMSKNEITFPKMESMIYIGTAGSKKFGRGDTITHLHCSEFAYWPDAEGLLGGLLDAVPLETGEIAIESTGNGMNSYYDRCIRAAEGNSTFKCHFLPWHTFEEYSLKLSKAEKKEVMDNLIHQWDENRLVKEYGLTAGQIGWRRMRLDDKNYNLGLFRQEYPMTLDECFQASGTGLFTKVNYKPNEKKWVEQGNNFFIWDQHPIPGRRYVLGGDPAGGVGGDNSAIEIIDIENLEQVGEYASNRIQPDVFGDKVAEIAKLFNGAYVVIESNNHGPITLKRLSEVYDLGKIHTSAVKGNEEDRSLMALGVRTTARNKPILIGITRTAISHGLIIHSPLLKSELDTFIETETGKLEADQGKNDDRVISLTMALRGLNEAAYYAGTGQEDVHASGKGYINPFSFEAIMESLRKSQHSYPIAPQHRGASVTDDER